MKKVSRLHFSILNSISAAIFFLWLTFVIIFMFGEAREPDGDDPLIVTFRVVVSLLAPIATLWTVYFSIYGIVKFICHITKNHNSTILWLGMMVFIAGCLFATVLELYFRQFAPIALAIIVFTAVLFYTTKKISSANEQKD